jgi:hypothetical protein
MYTQTRNGTIDIFRVIAAILVIGIHTDKNATGLEQVTQTVGRIAVPFFMMVTSYYAFKHDTVSQSIKHLLKIWGIWSLVYLPITIIALAMQQLPLALSIGAIAWGLIGKQVIFTGAWYFIATAFGLWVVSKLQYRPKVLYTLATFSLLFCLAFSGYCGWTNTFPAISALQSNLWFQDTLLTGIIWTSAGFAIGKCAPLQNSKLVLICTLSAIGLVVEYWLGLKFGFALTTDVTLCLLPFSVSAVMLMLTHPISISSRASRFCRRFSLNLFVLQFLVMLFAPLLGLGYGSGWTYFLFVLVGTAILAGMGTLNLGRHR